MAAAQKDVFIGAQALPHFVGVEVQCRDQLIETQQLARVLDAYADDFAVGTDRFDAFEALHLLGRHLGERLTEPDAEVDSQLVLQMRRDHGPQFIDLRDSGHALHRLAAAEQEQRRQ